MARRSASTWIGTSLIVMATRISRWWAVSAWLMASRTARIGLGCFGVFVGSRALVGDQRPVCGIERDLAVLPGASAELDAGFEQRELVGPGGEAALTAEVVELAEDRQQSVVGALLGKVVVVATAHVGRRATAAVHLEACGAKQQLAQVT